VIEKMAGMNATETGTREALWDTCCVVIYFHFASTWLPDF